MCIWYKIEITSDKQYKCSSTLYVSLICVILIFVGHLTTPFQAGFVSVASRPPRPEGHPSLKKGGDDNRQISDWQEKNKSGKMFRAIAVKSNTERHINILHHFRSYRKITGFYR